MSQRSSMSWPAVVEELQTLRDEMAKVVVAPPGVIDDLVTAVVAGGHVLLEGPPGVGKTLLATTLAEALGLTPQRVQFTPDLMPADLLGTFVIMETPQGRRTFEFQKGPIFTHLLLADHLNRGTPKTQSALLEALEGPAVTMGHERFQLPQPFIVIAAQNPQESEGTFPLPEAELDRFCFKLLLPGLSAEQLDAVLLRTLDTEPPHARAVSNGPRLAELQTACRQTPLPDALRKAITGLVAATRPDNPHAPNAIRQMVRYGAGVRAAQALAAGVKVRAALAGRTAPTVADLRQIAPAALRHRLVLNFEGQAEGVSPDTLLAPLLDTLSAA